VNLGKSPHAHLIQEVDIENYHLKYNEISIADINPTIDEEAMIFMMSILFDMGFDRVMVAELFKREHPENLQEAVELLVKGENGWNHKFIKDVNKMCKVCGEKAEEHVNIKLKMQDKYAHKVAIELNRHHLDGAHDIHRNNSLLIRSLLDE
jgi:hypothetical protein